VPELGCYGDSRAFLKNIKLVHHRPQHDIFLFFIFNSVPGDRLCGLVVRVLDYRCRSPGFDSRALKKSSGSGTGSTQPREYN
jgi:hypothetical protein